VFARTERTLVARAVLALIVANVRYWTTVAPLVRSELARWRERAMAISDLEMRELALAKLDGERFNAEAGAMLATLAPRAHRADAVEAIVALQVLFDVLDGLTERPLQDPLADGERTFAPFVDALSPSVRPYSQPRGEEDYLQELSSAVRGALARLPARAAVIELATASAQRAAHAQIRMHATPQLGIDQLQIWAQEQEQATGLQWRELAAGAASSVLAVHALTAAAADARTTFADAERIEGAYLYICVLLTLLDSLVDRERDERAGEAGYISLYEDPARLAQTLAEAARRAADRARKLPGGAHHVMLLTGVVAYYTSTPDVHDERARAPVARLHRDLAPLIGPILLFMRVWRVAARLRAARAKHA
jgi:tetraprenyl-beta-curcumene synthase